MAMMDMMMKAMMGSMEPGEKQDTMLKMMPQMMKEIKGSDIMAMLRDKMLEMMFVIHKSKFGYAETLKKIQEAGLENGWYNPAIQDHYELEKSLELEDPNKMGTVSMCLLRSAHEILKENKNVGVMMPMQINVYEEEGEVFIVWLNLKMMGKMFGDKIEEVMEKTSDMLMQVHKDILKEEA